jgi:hypothetical protein
MKSSRTAKSAPMSADAYAGFLKLLLTPGGTPPRPSTDLDAYLRYASARSPLSADTRRALGQSAAQAA